MVPISEVLATSAAGASAGAIAAVITCPLDVIKVVMQVQRRHDGPGHHHSHHAAVSGNHPAPRFDTVTGSVRELYHRGGVRGLYRGLGITMAAFVPNWAVYFTVYTELQRIAIEKTLIEPGPRLHVFAAVGAGLVTDVAINPLWMLKTRMQTQDIARRPERQYTNALDAVRKILQEEGPRAFYKGLVPQLFGVLHVGVQFPLYEELKSKLRRHRRLTDPDADLATTDLIIASSTSKAVASVVAYPHEVLRARFQFQRDSNPHRYLGIRDAVVRIAHEEGYRGFYRGMVPNLMRVVPSAAITITCYEMFTKLFKAHLSG